MSTADVTLDTTNDTSRTFEYIGTSNGAYSARRKDTSSSIAEPRFLDIEHTTGSSTKPDRHLVRFSDTQQNSTTLEFKTGIVHTVFTVPRDTITVAEIQELWAKMVLYMTAQKVADICGGSLG
jgi:hypothetical protein